MLVEAAIADGYGMAFELAEELPFPNDLSCYRSYHPGINGGRYGDDAQMSLAVAELLLSKVEWTPKNIAAKFVECFHRDMRRGYAGGFYRFLCLHEDADGFVRDIIPTSDRNGAAMRAAPIG